MNREWQLFSSMSSRFWNGEGRKCLHRVESGNGKVLVEMHRDMPHFSHSASTRLD
jgi:hypothetical protein